MKRFGLVGHPLGHSLSPEIHRRILEIAGVDGTYALHDIEPADLPRVLPTLLASHDGLNCTIPHKQAVIPFLRELDASAADCGAVNTICRGRGWNTDGEGFLASGVALRDRDVLILGAGGSARMMASACVAHGARSVTLRARSAGRAEAIVADLLARAPEAAGRMRVDDGSFAGPFGTILNATPLGMWPHVGGLPCEPGDIASGADVFDAIYNPTPTRLVLQARRRGARACGGLAMLLRQAIAAQRIWNPEVRFDTEAIMRAVLPDLVGELHRVFPIKILLVGFMGCGKSAVGRMLARRLGLAFIDLDAAVVDAAGRPIADIFAERGEAGFRQLERDVAESALRHGPSAVVAAGGGLPVAEANRRMIRETNTLVVHIDIAFEEAWRRIACDPARPLARDPGTARGLFEARQPIYREFSDTCVSTDAHTTPGDVAAAIARALEDTGAPT
ncbi:MAG: shikimate kinase [Kiritimatiellia bacterium]|jgi:shikimate dehydrogenase